jgi:hypothetical protein
MNQPNAYDSAGEDGCERKASGDGRTVFDLSIAIVMKSDAPLE